MKRLNTGQLILSLVAVLIGALVAYAVYGFLYLIEWFHLLLIGNYHEAFLITILGSQPWWKIVLVPSLGGLVIGLFIHWVLPERRNHGVPDVIAACALQGGRMSPRAGLGAIVAAAASISVGASVGREGPAVHMGATLGAWIAELLRLSRTFSLTVLGCGVAAAVAASFNAPIAGVFFALEVVLGHYALRTFAPLVISSVSATVVTRLHWTDSPAFDLPDYFIKSLLEVPLFALLGVICALVGVMLIRGISFVQDHAQRLPLPVWARPAVGGLLIGLIALQFPQVMGVGYQATDLALKEALPLMLLASLLLAKLIATSLALGSGFAGGVFSPSLFLGAMTGGCFGLLLTGIFHNAVSSPGAYTIVGMGGVAAAVLGAPISTILIIFELTSDYQLTIAVMIVATLASVVLKALMNKPSFFLDQLARRGIELPEEEQREAMLSESIEPHISKDYHLFTQRCSNETIKSILAENAARAVLLTDNEHHLVAGFTRHEVMEFLALKGDGESPWYELPGAALPKVLAHASLERALFLMAKHSTDYLIVVDDMQSDQVQGVVYYRDLVVAGSRLIKAAR